MRNFYKIMAMTVVAMAAAVFTGCSSDDDFLTPYEESAIQTRAISSTNAIIDFDNVPSSVMASDQYGNNLYSATANGNQVTRPATSLKSSKPVRTFSSRLTI